MLLLAAQPSGTQYVRRVAWSGSTGARGAVGASTAWHMPC